MFFSFYFYFNFSFMFIYILLQEENGLISHMCVCVYM
jgi:hypothetical protein